MKRLIVVVVVVLAAVFAAAPLVTGYLMENTLAGTTHFPGARDALELEVTDYRRGYLESRAESELVLRLPEREPVTVRLTHRIDQLPGADGRYATVLTNWEPTDSDVRAELVEVFGEEIEFALATALYPTGASRSTGEIPAIDRDGVDFSGAQAQLDTHADGRFDYRLESDRLALDAEADSSLVAEGLRLAASGQVADDGFVWDADGRLSLDHLAADDGGERGRAEDLVLRIDTARDEEQWGFALDYRVGEALVDGESFRDAQMRVAVERLDAAAVRALSERAEALQELAARGGSVDEAFSEAVMAELPALIKHGPRVAIDPLRATTDEGDSRLRLSGELPAGMGEGEPNPMMWMAILSALVIEGDLQVPLALLEKSAVAGGQPAAVVEEQLAPLVAQGWLAIEDGVVTTTVDFRQGNLELNGTSANQLLNMAFGG